MSRCSPTSVSAGCRSDRRIAPGACIAPGASGGAGADPVLDLPGALGLICGEVGAGKTCAARAAVAGLDRSRHTIIYLANPAVGTRGIYCQIVKRLGGEPHHYKANLIPQACELLERERTERAKQVVLLVDEAHLLSPAQLEELRLLTNAEMDSQSPFAGILLGQPTLRKKLRMGSFAALDQRIALRYELPGMSEQESAEYVRHHLRARWAQGQPVRRRCARAACTALAAGSPDSSTTSPPRR